MARPIGSLVARKKDAKRGEKGITLGSLWEPPFRTDSPMYSLMLGNRDPKYGPDLDGVLELLEDADSYFLNVYLNDAPGDDEDDLDDLD